VETSCKNETEYTDMTGKKTYSKSEYMMQATEALVVGSRGF
jgi:hypothetical protein